MAHLFGSSVPPLVLRHTIVKTSARRWREAGCSVSLFALLAVSGCASQVSTADNQTFHSHYDAGDFKGAAGIAMAAGQVTDAGQTKNIVWSLNAGAALFHAGDPKRAVAVLDTTEQLAQANDNDHMHKAIDYQYTTYDGVMTNTYKALAALSLNDKATARVEFNRAEDRQRKAEELFQAEAAASRRQHNEASAPGFDQAFGAAQANKDYTASMANLTAMAAYAPFENPFETYLSGVFFVTEGDYQKGIDRLKRAKEILGATSQAAIDYDWAQKAHRKHARDAVPQVWVVLENGQSATYSAMQIVLPTVTGMPMTLALPVLNQNAPAYPFFRARRDGIEAESTNVGTFDYVMASEFKRRQPVIMAEAIAEVVLKNVAAEAAKKSGNAFVQLAVGIADNISTADTRSWTALPKDFQALRIPVPGDGVVQVNGPNGEMLATAHVPQGQASLVYIKVQRAGAQPAIQVIPL